MNSNLSASMASPIPHTATSPATQTQENVSSPSAPATLTWLQPLALVHNPQTWTYFLPTGHQFPVSVTGVISAVTKTPTDLERINQYRHDWEPRGLACHSALETFLRTQKTPITGEGTPYEDWIRPLLRHKLWSSCEPVASELPLYDTRRNVAGTTDAVLQLKNGTYAVLDLKTQSKATSSPYDTKPQLGAYLAMLNEHYPTLYVSTCLTLWARPNKTVLQSHDPDACWAAWDDVFSKYEMLHREF